MPTILEFSEDRNSPYVRNMFEFGPRVNAGDSAAILYESPYGDRYKLWLQKTKRIPRDEQTEQMKSGVLIEPLIFEWYQTYKGVTGGSQAWGLHDEYPWIQAKADFWNAERRLLAEFKAPTRDDTKSHAMAKRGEIPRHYLLQCVHTLEVFDADELDFVSWRSADDFAVIPVKRDPELWCELMLPCYAEFWEAIQNDAYPKPEGTEIQTSEEWRMQVQRYLTAKEMRVEADEYETRAKAALQRMATAKTTTGGGIRATYVNVKPRWEVVVTAESEAARDAILKAVNPLEGKKGVKKIGQRSYPPSLWFKVTREGETE